MDLPRIYVEFIADRRTREGSLTVFDRHHILPTCLGGGNEPENLIYLSPSDHLFAHRLLASMHGGELLLAFILMLDHERFLGRRTRLRYSVVRDRMREHLSLRASGQWSDPDHRERVSSLASRQWSRPLHRERVSAALARNQNASGAVRSRETRAKVSASWTPERRAAQAERNRQRAVLARTGEPA